MDESTPCRVEVWRMVVLEATWSGPLKTLLHRLEYHAMSTTPMSQHASLRDATPTPMHLSPAMSAIDRPPTRPKCRLLLSLLKCYLIPLKPTTGVENSASIEPVPLYKNTYWLPQNTRPSKFTDAQLRDGPSTNPTAQAMR